MIPVLLGLGSNAEFGGRSCIELLATAGCRLASLLTDAVFSSVYESKAMYVTKQANFYNMAAKGFVPDGTDPFALLSDLNAIEAELGRDRSKEIRFGPRSMDIDIEEFGAQVIDTPRLQVPHPRMREREFVLIPALEILDESADCKIRETLFAYARALPSQGVAKCPEQIQTSFRSLLEGGIHGSKSC